MIIQRKKQISYIRNLGYPVLDNDVQKDLDDTNSVTFFSSLCQEKQL